MRWEDLFTDLERQWEGLAEHELQAEIAERTRAELAQVGLLDRLRGSEGHSVTVRTRAGQDVSGTLSRVGADFMLLTGPRQECLVPLAAVAAVAGLGPQALSAEAVGAVRARLGLGSALRRVAADRSVVSVLGCDGRTRSGTVQRVGADFLELAEHPAETAPRARDVRRTTVLPFAAVAVLRRAQAAPA